MQTTITYSDTVIGGLCREVCKINSRCIQLTKSIDSCKNCNLNARLESEYKELLDKKKNILKISRSIEKTQLKDDLSIEFLIEISSRMITT